MRNLWRFISKYNAFFLFVIFFTVSIILLIRNNDFQRASTFNSSNKVVGQLYQQVNEITKYLNLERVNENLAEENARLRSQLPSAYFKDSLVSRKVLDTIHHVQYEYIEAEVINKTITSRNNYLTIDRGAAHGIKKGWGVIGPSGVVGIVWNVSENFASVQSILHEDVQISSAIEGTSYFGPLIWEGKDPNVATLTDIPNQVNLKKGTNVVTSGLGVIFPKGIMVGKIIQSGVKGKGSFLDINVKLATDFYALQHVYIVKNNFANEVIQLEEQNKESIHE